MLLIITQAKMNKEFVPYEEALALKDLGFDEPCFGGYYENIEDEKYLALFDLNKLETEVSVLNGNDDILAPLYQQVFRWFRNKGFGINIYSKDSKNIDWYFLIERPIGGRDSSDNVLKSYEEAELECLKKLIEIVKAKK